MAWTDERVDLLKKLWAEGLSARQIADQLGGVTRNAVIGKVHRLGLSGRATPTRPKVARPRKKPAKTSSSTSQGGGQSPQAAVAEKAASPQQSPGLENFPRALLTPIDELVIPIEDRVTIETLKESQCKWPIGDPAEEDFHFCGHDRHEDGVYCEFHKAKAYHPARRGARKKTEKKMLSFGS